MREDIKMTSDMEGKKNIISIHTKYPIPQFNWTLEFVFNQSSYSKEEALKLSNRLSPLLGKDKTDKLTTLFNPDTYNSAITVSNKNSRESIMLITQVTSIGQFINSLVHEMLHLSRHIDECGNNEELFTILGNLSGSIVQKLYSL